MIAMPIMWMMQMASDEIVDMIAVRNGFMATSGGMNVSVVVSGALMSGRAISRIRFANFQHTLVRVVFMGMVKVAIVNVIDVITMANRPMTAILTVNVFVIRVRCVAHGFFYFPCVFEDLTGNSSACSRAARMSSRTCSSASE